MSLHVDYRPGNLNEMIGNRGVVKSHEAIFSRESDWPHAVLYIGPSGCGKTTLARIYAQEVGCSAKDMIEINAANNNGIATARDIQTTMKFAPFSGKVKCYIIDEVGATTKDFQVAMLKALEDAPGHVYFLMATTDPQNLLPTLKNRCHQFEMSLLSVPELEMLVKSVLAAEKVDDMPPEVIKEIAIVADGCPRQALVVLDQVVDLAPEDMMDAVQDLRVSDKNTKDLCQALLRKDKWSSVSAILKAIDLTKAEDIRRGVLNYMTAVLLSGKDNPQAAMVMEFFREPTYNSGKAGLVWASYNSVI